MKVVIVSDIHGNDDALRALPEDYDELWVLGDLVNYGPQPAEVVERIMATASVVVRGNHDHAVAYDDDSRWSGQYRALAEASKVHTSSVLSGSQKSYLRALPLTSSLEREGTSFHLVHATPSNPLYKRRSSDSQLWAHELGTLQTDVLLVGHTHIPFMRQVGNKVLLNPGSLGQSRAGEPLANYAVWQNGRFKLKSFRYDLEATVEKLKALSLPSHIEQDLARILRTGSTNDNSKCP